mgnify:CR=1 FL=1
MKIKCSSQLARHLFLLLTYVSFSLTVCAQRSHFSDQVVYKQVDTVALKLAVYKPEQSNKREKYPAIVFFFGGGWNSRNIDQFIPFAEHLAARGMVALIADYRVKSRQGTSPFESLKDAKSAVRYIRQQAEVIGIDPDRIVASGGSAGGHLAAACYTNQSINESTDPLAVSSKPNALVLFNPVIDNSKDGYGYDRIKEKFPEFSPIHSIRESFPPTIFFLGTEDKLIPVSTAKTFKQRVEETGGRCDLHLYEGAGHGFFNAKEYRELIIPEVDRFLESLDFIGKRTANPEK